MKRFVESENRGQATLLPASLEDYVGEDNPVRVIDAFIDELDLGALGFSGVVPQATGRPGYHPAALLKIYLYGYLNRIQSSRRLERETQRNIELMWLTTEVLTTESGVGEALLAQVAELESDLLVMGCYGRFRLSELIFGGATRYVLKHMTVPVLMSY